MFLTEPVIKIKAPSTALVSLNEQSAENRWVIHLLHYMSERRCQDFDIIEDVIPIYDVAVSVKVPKKVSDVICVPNGYALKFEEKDGRIDFILPKLEGHQMIAVSFAK